MNPPALPQEQNRLSTAPGRGELFAVHYAIHFLMTLVPVAICLNLLLRVAPRFKEVFKDFRTTLPVITQRLMALSDMTRSDLWVLFALAAVVVPLLSAWICSRQPTRRDRAVWGFFVFNIMFFLTMVFVFSAQAAIYAPLFKLVESVSGGDHPGE